MVQILAVGREADRSGLEVGVDGLLLRVSAATPELEEGLATELGVRTEHVGRLVSYGRAFAKTKPATHERTGKLSCLPV